MAYDDYAGGTSTSGQIAGNGSVSGRLDFDDDSDWFRISLTAGTKYTFSLSESDPWVEVHNSSGTELASEFGSVTYTPTSSGTYYVAVRDWFTQDLSPLNYTLTAMGVGSSSDDYAGSTSTSGQIAGNSSVSGRLDFDDDSDWFRISLTAGTKYTFSLSESDPSFDPWVEVHNSSGTELASEFGSVTYTPTSSGTYYVAVRDWFSLDLSPLNYTLTAMASSSDDYAGSTSTSGQIAGNGSVSGRLDFDDDSDWFRISLTAGTKYTFSLSESDPSFDPWVEVHNSSGTELASEFGSVTYTPTSSGTYYVAVRDWFSLDLSPLNYTLTAMASSSDDYAGSTSTSGQIAGNGSVSGRLDFDDDSDWFRISLTAGTKYTFSLSESDPSFDPWVEVHNSSGTELASEFGSVTYTPTSSGTYYVAVRDWFTQDLSPLNYTLTAKISGGYSTLTGTNRNDKLNGGAGNDILNGLGGKDVLQGNGGDDVLNGGLNNDVLIGGFGNDVFKFDSKLSRGNVDNIKDFISSHDTLYLDDAVFTKIGITGQFSISDERFWISENGIAHDSTDRVIYDPSGGTIFYDADGNGTNGAIPFATLIGNPTLTATDILSG